MIESNLGDQMPDSPTQQRPWVWGSSGIVATRFHTSNTTLVLTEREASVEFDDEFNPA